MSTFQALAVSLIAVLPGASYTFAYERIVGSFGVSFSDRLIRFSAASAIFHAFASGVELHLYREFIASGRLAAGDVSAWKLQMIAMAYVLLPTAVGSGLGTGRRKGWTWVRWLTGSSPEPRAWDVVWTRPGMTVIVRLRLKSERWIAGFYGNVAGAPSSYAAGHPENADLFLGLQIKVDRDTGAFELDGSGAIQAVEGRTSLLVRWDEVEYADLMEV